MPVVTVIITTFNSRSTLWRAIESVMKQDYARLQLVVVNDDTEDTIGEEILERYPHVIYFCDGVNRGGAGARNIGVDLSTGDYIAFLDDDDVYCVDKVSYLVSKVNEYPGYDAYFGATLRNSDHRSFVEDTLNPRRIKSVREVGVLHTIGSIIDRKVFSEIRYYSPLRKYQDTQFHIELIERKEVVYFGRKIAIWNKDLREDQITKMTTLNDYIKSIFSYHKMVVYLRSRSIRRSTVIYVYALLAKHFLALFIKHPALLALNFLRRR